MAVAEVDLREFDVAHRNVDDAAEAALDHAGHNARINSSAEKKCTVDPASPVLARQRAEIGRRLAHAGIGDEDVGVRTGGEGRGSALERGDVRRHEGRPCCRSPPRFRRGRSSSESRGARDEHRRRRPRAPAPARPRRPSPLLPPQTSARRPAIPNPFRRSIKGGRVASGSANRPSGREGGGEQPRRHAEAAGDVLQLLALGDDVRVDRQRPARLPAAVARCSARRNDSV